MRVKFLNSKSGTTLIEVLVAIMIIPIVIMGGGMFFFYGRVQIVREAHRRAATVVASKRLEELKRAKYSEITSGDLTLDSPYWIVWDEGNNKWKCLKQFIEDPGNENFSYDYVTVDNLEGQKILTQARIKDDNGDDESDHLEATVIVEWTNGANRTVKLDTLIAPREALP